MTLKQDLKDLLTQILNEKLFEVTSVKNSLEALENLDQSKAVYNIELISHWQKRGERNVRINHKGSLREAIETSEQEFMRINERKDIQAIYSVEILIGNEFYYVPVKYWEEFKRKN